jgi:hypothetical protein
MHSARLFAATLGALTLATAPRDAGTTPERTATPSPVPRMS